MDDQLRQVMTSLHGMWRRRWVGLTAAWIVGIIAAIVALKTPEQYEATARFKIDTQSILRPLLSGLAAEAELPEPHVQVAMLSRTLVSRPNVQRLVQAIGIDKSNTDPAEVDELVSDLLQRIKVISEGEELEVFTLSVRHPDPEMAERVAGGMVTVLMESTAGLKRQDADQAQKFLDEQIKLYEHRLDEAESRLKGFKLRNLQLTGEGRDYLTRMSVAQEELGKARLELRAAENSRDALRRELAGEQPIVLAQPENMTRMAVPEIDGRLDAQRKQLDELKRRYTDAHPDVVATKRLIAQLETERKQIIQARHQAAASSGGSLSDNPVIQQLRVSLSTAEANVASLQARVAELNSRYATMRAEAERMPQIEAELAQLNRDYDVQHKNYQELIARREAAGMSGRVGAAGVDARFRVIEPARASREPVMPTRLVMLVGALAAALAAGLAASLAASLVAPVVHDTRALREVAQRPVLGAVSMASSKTQASREFRHGAAFLGGLGGLIAIFFVLLYVMTVAVPKI
ncbi:MAG: chain length-determining protein [Burkholderiales bacterium]|nr:chain length-determining protein [Burkholderiales bacterium]